MSQFNISGVSSGFEWGNILEQLMEIERQPIVKLQQRQQEHQAKIKVWQTINSQLSGLESAAESLRQPDAFDMFSTTLTSSSSIEASDILGVTTDDTASAGTYDMVVNQLATRQKVSSQSFTDTSSGLGISGQFLINGKEVSIASSDSLAAIRDAINNANSGDDPTGVSASIIETSGNNYRLVLTSEDTGSDGMTLLEASSGTVLQDLGLVDSSTSLAYKTSDGAESGAFTDTNSAIGTVLGLSNAQSGTVTIGGENIAIDLSTDSLVDIANKIDAASGISASVVSETNDDGETVYRIDVSGSTDFVDSSNVLQTLGFIESGFSDVQEVHASDVANTDLGGSAITSTTTFGMIDTGGGANNVTNGDTITISGTDHNGNSVSSTFTISDKNTDTVGDLLAEIETAFGGASAVDAYISDGTDGFDAGTLVVQDLQGGESSMEVSLTTNNEGGGTLDFGTVSASTEGYSMEIQSGQDAFLTVDGVTMTRSSNTVDDVIEGVTLDLYSAAPSTTVTLDIDRDNAGIQESVQGFIDAYNTIIGTISKQFSYTEEEGTGGILFGDGTLRSVQSDVRSVILQQMENLEEYSSLADIGIHIDKNGFLSLNEIEFTAALEADPKAVQRVFSGLGTTDTPDLEYVRHTSETTPGTYEVDISQVATQASVTGTADLSGGLSSQQSISVTTDGATASLTFDAGTDIDSIVSALNSEFDSSYTQTLTESTSHTDASTGDAITASTTWENVDAGDVSNGETITISGTTRNGGAVSVDYTINDKTTDTVGDLLTKIEDAFGGNVTATITSDGKIQVKDDRDGESSLSMSLTYNGGGSLSFGTMDETTTGRYALALTASKSDNNELVLTYDRYGSNSFSVTADAEFGIADGTYSGQDVAGTINGESATGNGQSLKADDGITAEGLRINYTGSSTGVVGDVTVSYGVAESMYQRLDGVIDPFNGYVSNKIDSLQDRVQDFDDQIEKKEDQVELKRQHLFNKFVSMEMAISSMQAESNWLNSQLGSLSQFL